MFLGMFAEHLLSVRQVAGAVCDLWLSVRSGE